MNKPSGHLWLRTAAQRAVVAAHLRHVTGAFASLGWVVLEDSVLPEPPLGAPLVVVSDPLCEPTPALAAVLIQARDAGEPRWRAPRV